MATVQKSISESSSYTTRTLTTTISVPGIRQDAIVSVSPQVDASKVSYTINEAAGTIKVTLTNVGYTSSQSYITYPPLVSTTSETIGNDIHLTCRYENGYVKTHSFPVGTAWIPCSDYTVDGYVYYAFDYTVTVTYKTFPEFKARQGGKLKTAADGWVRVNGQLKQIQQIWVRVNGQLKEV